jgi:hypothetical protein
MCLTVPVGDAIFGTYQTIVRTISDRSRCLTFAERSFAKHPMQITRVIEKTVRLEGNLANALAKVSERTVPRLAIPGLGLEHKPELNQAIVLARG